MIKKLILATIAFSSLSLLSAQNVFQGKMDKNSVAQVCDTVSSWQIKNHSLCKHNKLDWTSGTLYRGMVEWGQVGANKSCIEFVSEIGKSHKWNMYKRPLHADDICVGQAFIELFRITGDKTIIQPTIERAFYVASHPSNAPLLKTDKIGKDERWSWCDALFMAPPVYAALYTITGEKLYVDYMDAEYKACVDALYDEQEKLFYRDCKRIHLREPNGAKQLWGRGNGWVFGGLPLVIQNLPKSHPTRDYYINLFKDMATAVLKTQDKNGSWHSSLLDPVSYPLPENSASAFFCYGLAWGINNNYLSEPAYYKALEKGWAALVSGVHSDGKLGYIQPVGAAPKKEVGFESTDIYGVGAFLLAGSEIYKMSNK